MPRSKGAPALGVDQVRATVEGGRRVRGVRAEGSARPGGACSPRPGCARSELLALRWEDVDLDGKVLTVAGSIVRLKGVGLVRQDTTKGGDARSVPLPQFAVDALHRRKGEQPRASTAGVLFPSSAGTLRDPDNFGKQWREVRDSLGLAGCVVAQLP